jgi:UDP-2,3-diacylglucosamine hydrolase
VKRLFLADLHLEDPAAPNFRAFDRLIRGAAARVDEIYLLGDLCEVWVGDDDDGPLAKALTATLRTAARACAVHLMHGNRDFLFGDGFAHATGVRLIDDPHRLPDGTLLAHGDAYCIDDHEYQATRALLRSAEWQRAVRQRSLAERRALAADLRARSRASNANKAANIMDVNTAEVARVAAGHGARRIIHGHTHRPAVHRERWGRRYVLGAWERCGWLLLEDDSANLRLRCFAMGAAPERAIV